MADDTATMTASADATETSAAPASTPSEPTLTSQREAAEAAIAGKGIDAVRKAYEPKAPAKEPEPAGDELENADDDAGKPEVPETPASTLTASEQQTLSRFQLDEQDLPADPKRREKFLKSLEQRAKDQDALGGRLANLEQKLKAQEQPPQNGQQQATAQAEADYWKPFNETLPAIFGEEDAGKIGPSLRGAIDGQQKAYHEAMVEPMRRSIQQAFETLEAMHTAAGFSAAEAPEGVDLKNPVNRKAVLAEANAELQRRAGEAGFKLAEFNLTHAIPWAVQKLYQDKINEARTKAEKERRAKAVRGTPDKGSRETPGKAAMSEHERQLAAAKAALEGRGADGVRAAYDGQVAA